MVKDIPSIPLFARPIYVIRAKHEGSRDPDPTRGRPWNVTDWTPSAKRSPGSDRHRLYRPSPAPAPAGAGLPY